MTGLIFSTKLLTVHLWAFALSGHLDGAALREQALRAQVPVDTFWALAYVESGRMLHPPVSVTGARGRLQVMPRYWLRTRYAKDCGVRRARDLDSPLRSACVGAFVYADCRARFAGGEAIRCYNGSPRSSKTRPYLKSFTRALSRLHARMAVALTDFSVVIAPGIADSLGRIAEHYALETLRCLYGRATPDTVRLERMVTPPIYIADKNHVFAGPCPGIPLAIWHAHAPGWQPADIPAGAVFVLGAPPERGCYLSPLDLEAGTSVIAAPLMVVQVNARVWCWWTRKQLDVLAGERGTARSLPSFDGQRTFTRVP